MPENTIQSHIDFLRRLENRDSMKLTPKQVQSMMDMVSDPNGLRRAHYEQIDRADGQIDALIEINTTLSGQLAEISRQADAQEKQISELKLQVEAQQSIRDHLKEEADTRKKDDRKYFWIGVVASLIISISAALLTKWL
jgi:chromosome segregation ATPase